MPHSGSLCKISFATRFWALPVPIKVSWKNKKRKIKHCNIPNWYLCHLRVRRGNQMSFFFSLFPPFHLAWNGPDFDGNVMTLLGFKAISTNSIRFWGTKLLGWNLRLIQNFTANLYKILKSKLFGVLVSGEVIISIRRLFTETMMVLATSMPKISNFRFCNFILV